MSDTPKDRNINQETCPMTASVAAGTERNLTSICKGRKCCRLIENCSAGQIHYVNADGDTVRHDLFDLPTAIRPIEAQRILPETTCNLVVYF